MVAPLKARSKGILERRGSSALLTIDLSNSGSTQNNTFHLTPIKESFNFEKNENNKKARFLSRHELRRLNIRENLAKIFEEFAVLPSPSDSYCQKVVGCSQKNRHMVWPISKTRVRLSNKTSSFISNSPPLRQSTDESNCYINANYITNSDFLCAYIATEGPLCNTINNFWHMLWQEKSIAIVMITELEEQISNNGKYKRLCEKYWPDEKATYGDIEVEVLAKSIHDGIIIQELVLRREGKEHMMKHYWFTEWHDHGLPIGRINNVLKLINDLQTYRDQRQKEINNLSPVTVHCSAGIGRTCTFIAVALGVEQLCRATNGVDIYSIVSKLRMERYGAVQHPEQYAFIYLALQRMESFLSDPDVEEKINEPDFLSENFQEDENLTDLPLHNTSDLINLQYMYS